MDVKQNRILTITLNEDEINELKDVLSEINELWDSSEGELRQCYAENVIGKLWKVL